MYGVQSIVSGDVRDVHVARMRFYADAALEITAKLKEFFNIFSRTKESSKWQQLRIW